MAFAAEAYPPDGLAIPVVKNTEDAGGAFGQGLQTPPTPKPWDQQSLWNMKIEGTVDNQGRPIYQPLDRQSGWPAYPLQRQSQRRCAESADRPGRAQRHLDHLCQRCGAP